eukprot:GHVT01078382.1.p1 GENE.GHVT01078382.1~~GHVT01078382.1.p1  ORF type:complete len:235 (-),score=45.41 GHVT01078382.1:251-955(-)
MTQSSSQSYSINTAYKLPNPPSDTISQLAWAPQGQFLGCSSWDKTSRIWQVASQFNSLQANPAKLYTFEAPQLTCCFGPTPQQFFSGGCDKQVRLFDLGAQSTQGTLIAQHDQPIVKCIWNPVQNVLVTASWDGSVRMWDGKSPQPVWQKSLEAGCKIFLLDLRGSVMAIGDNNRRVFAFNLNNLSENPKEIHSSLKMQSRALGLFSDTSAGHGFVVASAEGRAAVMYLNPLDK